MEYTKDMIFGVRYDEVNNTIRGGRRKRTSRLFQMIRNHKVLTVAVLSMFVFICIDVVLISNFFRILTIM